MSGETRGDVSGWTLDSLKAHYDTLLTEKDLRYEQRFQAQQLGIRDALASAERAVSKADAATEKRFDGQNEFRDQLRDQAATFMPRAEYDRAHNDLVERVDQMRGAFTDRLAQLDLAVRTGTVGTEQRRAGSDAAWAYVVGGVGVAVGVVGAVVALTGT
jgi:hypothetical protein